jgi:error-prone DNA polymerase
MKRHFPDAFCCALLNAQPMGFYSSATLIEDAGRHGVVVLPVDVQTSIWDCTLEQVDPTLAQLGRRSPGDGGLSRHAVRVGLRYVRGLRDDAGRRIVSARARGAFLSIDDFARRTGCDDGALERLSSAGAFESIEGRRRAALWKSYGADRSGGDALEMEDREVDVAFAPLDAFSTIAWDYDATGHSTRGHPLAPIRASLSERGLPDARTVAAMPNGRRVRYAGVVITRQRPSTAKGVVFMTLEDETGFVNVVVWKNVYEKYRILAKTSSFLGVTGRIQSESGVVHLVADSLWEPNLPVQPKKRHSRDFH